MKIRSKLLVPIICIFLAVQGLLPNHVVAKSATMLTADPVDSSVQVGTTVAIRITVLNGNNINAFDVTVVYDPSILKLESWSFGGYLSNLALIHKQEDPGSLNLAATQLARTGVSGNGTLITLMFRTLSTGNSTIAITNASLATSAGELVVPGVVSGKIAVSAGNTPTMTATFAQVSSLFPTITGTLQHSATLTASSSSLKTAYPSATPWKGTNKIPNATTIRTKPSSSFSNSPTAGAGAEIPNSAITLSPVATPFASVRMTTAVGHSGIPASEDPPVIPQALEKLGAATINIWLWGITIFLLVILIIVILLGIRRKKQK